MVVCVCYVKVSGQATRTPISAYGFGDTFNDALIHNQGMGGVGVSNPQYWYLNNMNPALLTFNRITVFQAGLQLENKRIYSDTLKEKNRGGNLNYLALGFPLSRDKITGETIWGTSIGLMPYSNVDYSYRNSSIVPNSGGTEVEYFEKSKGGIDQVYWSHGLKVNRYLSMGLKTSFLFGSIATNFSNILDNPNQSYKYVINVYELLSVRGVRFTPGIHLRIDSLGKNFRRDHRNGKYTLNFGATADFKSKLSTNLEQVLERKDASGNILQSDTTNVNSIKTYLPGNFTVGISFGRADRWILGTDFSMMNPKVGFLGDVNTIISGLDKTRVTKGWRLAIGAEVTPDIRSLGSYLKRVTYRTGISSESGTYLVNGNPVKDFGINFGFSLPVNRISSLDLAFRTGKRGDQKLNGIEENYFKIYFGVTFNDQWFIKRRFD